MGSTIVDSLHLVSTILEIFDGNAALINCNHSKAFENCFFETALSAAGLKVSFRSWIRLLYAFPWVMVEMNGIRSKAFFSINSSELSTLDQALRSCVGTCSSLSVNPALVGLTLPSATIMSTYPTYADDVCVLVTPCYLSRGGQLRNSKIWNRKYLEPKLTVKGQ